MTSLTTKERGRGEDELQKSLVAYLFANRADKWCVWTAINPGGDRKSPATALRHKKMGLRPGVADLLFVLRTGHACFMELKSDTGRQNPSQVEFQSQCDDHNIAYALVSSFDQAVAVLEGWGVVRKRRAA